MWISLPVGFWRRCLGNLRSTASRSSSRAVTITISTGRAIGISSPKGDLLFDQPAHELLDKRRWVRKAVVPTIWVPLIQALGALNRLLQTVDQTIKDLLVFLIAWQAVIAAQRLAHLIGVMKRP